MATPTDRIDQAETLLRDLERVEAQLHQLQDGLTRSHRLATLGTMASIIAHEFNNILTPMISYCQMAEQSPDDIEMLRNVVLDEVSNCMARPPEKDGIQCHIDIPEDTYVAMSPTGAQQVLLNLVLNARQAMRRNGGHLSITARQAVDTVTLDISDTGPGIPQDLIPHVFTPSIPRRQAEPGQPRGTGLGLAICSDLIERAGGQITIVKSDSDGTTFRIELPAADPPGETSE